MSRTKARVTVTLDPELVEAGNAAVRAGRAASLSEWINGALLAETTEARRQRAARRAVVAYARAFGTLTLAEIEMQVDVLRQRAVRVRPGRAATGRSRAA